MKNSENVFFLDYCECNKVKLKCSFFYIRHNIFSVIIPKAFTSTFSFNINKRICHTSWDNSKSFHSNFLFFCHCIYTMYICSFWTWIYTTCLSPTEPEFVLFMIFVWTWISLKMFFLYYCDWNKVSLNCNILYK